MLPDRAIVLSLHACLILSLANLCCEVGRQAHTETTWLELLYVYEGEQLRSALPRSSSGFEDDPDPKDLLTDTDPAEQPSVCSAA